MPPPYDGVVLLTAAATLAPAALLHCPGMCGPLMLAFRFGLERPTRAARVRAALAQLAAYQAGRALVYAALGAAAGWLGARFTATVAGGARALLLVLALILLLTALAQVLPWRRWLGRRPSADATPLAARLARPALRLAAARPFLGAGALGVAIGFLPCALTYAALGLAAATAAPMMGALVLLVQVAVTTTPLAAAVLLPAVGLPPAWSRSRLGQRLGRYASPALMALAALWIALPLVQAPAATPAAADPATPAAPAAAPRCPHCDP